ncbi:MAG: RAMP superfamily CRISPR-associated protein [Meiothermus sp.]|uniref:RAMP superfamily CRISPR-associated protein n=1 Tax=Meiothermus sp. TaxID=1955249 RepID=UPI00298F29D6|nr:RAMP superfamily CRISPR-associated protein [Meiothermus sp.]MDW8481320.1 RAMP superfamily CRISPR-associated protein [Meiothermus sp.]
MAPGSHAGLALNILLSTHEKPQSGEQVHPYAALVKSIAEFVVPKVYKSAFDRWKETLKDAVWLEATTKTPLAIGLGNSSPIENGLAIHHTYGVPYLPGSALKGLLRRVAERFGLSKAEKAVLLGEAPDPERKTQGNAAYLVYWDGWLRPSQRSALPARRNHRASPATTYGRKGDGLAHRLRRPQPGGLPFGEAWGKVPDSHLLPCGECPGLALPGCRVCWPGAWSIWGWGARPMRGMGILR